MAKKISAPKSMNYDAQKRASIITNLSKKTVWTSQERDQILKLLMDHYLETTTT